MSPLHPPHLLTTLLALALTGCVGTKGPPTQFYILSTLNASAPMTGGAHRPALMVEVSVVELPEYLDRPQIVTRTGPNRLEMAEAHQWGGNLRKDLGRILEENVSRLLQGRIGQESAGPVVRLEVEVLRFERMPDGRVGLAANWSILTASDRRLIATHFSEIASDPVAADDFPTIAATMSDLLGRLSRELADEILAQTKGRPNSPTQAR